MSKHKKAVKTAQFLLILSLVFGMLFSGLRILESTVFYAETREPEVVSRTVVKDGVAYFPRQDITVILAVGIDETGPVVSSGSYRNTGEADAIILLILDQADESYSILCLNRDTMVHMPALGLGGKQAGSYYGQLALSHTYGEGLQDSCENTRKAVSDFLNGIQIDYYTAMNMDAIGILNDAVGGVTVTVSDDFSQVDPTMTQGTMTLNAQQALHYVQTRKDVGNQLNISRMERHQQYMHGLMDSLKMSMEADDLFVMNLYDQIDEYVVTDCSVNTISGLLERCLDYTQKEIVTISGDNVLGEEFYEFYADQEALEDLVLRLFYAEK